MQLQQNSNFENFDLMNYFLRQFSVLWFQNFILVLKKQLSNMNKDPGETHFIAVSIIMFSEFKEWRQMKSPECLCHFQDKCYNLCEIEKLSLNNYLFREKRYWKCQFWKNLAHVALVNARKLEKKIRLFKNSATSAVAFSFQPIESIIALGTWQAVLKSWSSVWPFFKKRIFVWWR